MIRCDQRLRVRLEQIRWLCWTLIRVRRWIEVSSHCGVMIVMSTPDLRGITRSWNHGNSSGLIRIRRNVSPNPPAPPPPPDPAQQAKCPQLHTCKCMQTCANSACVVVLTRSRECCPMKDLEPMYVQTCADIGILHIPTHTNTHACKTCIWNKCCTHRH